LYYAGYFSGVGQDYVAVETAGGVCNRVPKAVSGQYLLSDDGYWEGSQLFQYSHALLAVEMNNLKTTAAAFQQQMEDLEIALSEWVSSASTNQSLAWNLLLLMEQRNTVDYDGYSQTIFYTALPSVVFNSETMYAALAGRDSGPCPVYTFPTFSAGDGLLSAAFDVELLQEQCNKTVQFSSSLSLSYATSIDHYISDFKFDMNSYSTAAAINMGYADVSVLEELLSPDYIVQITSFNYSATVGNELVSKAYSVKQMINPAHPGMAPIYCVHDDDSRFILACFLRRAFTFFLPILNHIGDSNASSYAIPDFCDW
jgi:hypothetical protein